MLRSDDIVVVSLLPERDAQALVQERPAYQIELEMQNEELRRALGETETLAARYHDLYDFAPVGYIALDTEGRILEANLASAALLGIGRRDLIYQRFSSFLAPDSQALYASLCLLIQDTDVKQSCDLRLLRDDNIARYIQAEFATVPEGEASDKQLRVALQDITARKQMEENLRESEARMHAILDTAVDAIISIDEAGAIERFNFAAETLFGYSAAEVIGRNVRMLMPDPYWDEHDVNRARYRQTGKMKIIGSGRELLARRKDASVFPVELAVSEVSLGEHSHFTGFVHDITARKKAERALELRERQQAAVAALGQCALLDIDLAALLETAARLVTQTLDVEFCNILELQPGGATSLLRAGVGWKEGAVGHAMVDMDATTQAGYALITGEPVVVESLPDESRFRGSPLMQEHRVLSGVTVLIQGQYEPYGVLGAHSLQPRSFNEDDMHFLQAIAYTLATVIERQKAEQSILEHVRALTGTLDALTDELELDRFLERTLKVLAEQLPAECATLWLADKSQKTLSLHLLYRDGQALPGAKSGHPDATSLLRLHMLSFWPEMIQARRPLVLHDFAASPQFPTFREAASAQVISTLLLVPLLLGQRALGLISLQSAGVRQYHPGELEFTQTVAQQATLAIQMARLAEQGQQTAVLKERNRMAQEIHDTLAQGFTGILVQLEVAADMLADAPQEAQPHIQRAHDLALDSLREARRSVRALRPQALEQNTLPSALAKLIVQMTADTGIEARMDIHGTAHALPEEMENNLLRIGQEALSNALKHAQAKTILLELRFEPSRIRLSVRDDGRGFDTKSLQGQEHFGLKVMRERAEEIGGHFQIASRPGQGTEVKVTVPTPAP